MADVSLACCDGVFQLYQECRLIGMSGLTPFDSPWPLLRLTQTSYTSDTHSAFYICIIKRTWFVMDMQPQLWSQLKDFCHAAFFRRISSLRGVFLVVSIVSIAFVSGHAAYFSFSEITPEYLLFDSFGTLFFITSCLVNSCILHLSLSSQNSELDLRQMNKCEHQINQSGITNLYITLLPSISGIRWSSIYTNNQDGTSPE